MIQKHGEQIELETLVVHAVTHEYLILNLLNLYLFKDLELPLTQKIFRLGTTIARLKLKGIDGGSLQTVEHVV